MHGNPYYEHYMETADSLEHYGVKGMEWGKRRRKQESTTNLSTSIARPIKTGITSAAYDVRNHAKFKADSAKTKTPYTDAAATGAWIPKSRTAGQSAAYNKEFERVAKNSGGFVTNVDNGRYTRLISYTPTGYKVNNAAMKDGAAGKYTTVSVEEMDEVINTGGKGKYASLSIAEDFTKDQLKQAQKQRAKIDSMTKVTVGTKAIGSKAVQSLMSNKVSQVKANAASVKKATQKQSFKDAAKTKVSSLFSTVKNKLKSKK